jgi:DNA modification methylase
MTLRDLWVIEQGNAYEPVFFGAELIWTDPPIGTTPAGEKRLLGRWLPCLTTSGTVIMLGPRDTRSERSQAEIAEAILRTTERGDLVADPFCGTGTTGVVAIVLGRRFYGCDSDPAMVRRARARLATGQDPG